MSDYKLGKKVLPPPPAKKADVIEKVGDVWKVNGKFQTNHPDPYWHYYNQVLRKQQEQMGADGLDISFMGWM